MISGVVSPPNMAYTYIVTLMITPFYTSPPQTLNPVEPHRTLKGIL